MDDHDRPRAQTLAGMVVEVYTPVPGDFGMTRNEHGEIGVDVSELDSKQVHVPVVMARQQTHSTKQKLWEDQWEWVHTQSTMQSSMAE